MSNVRPPLLVVVTASIVCICAAASIASAAAPIMLSVKGTKQGQFKGEGARDPSKMEAVAFSMEITSPRDVASGQASGRRQYKPLQITKRIGPSSPQFVQAVTTNEVLQTVTLDFVKTNANGEEIVFYSIKLTNASVASVRQHTASDASGGATSAKHTGADGGADQLEDIAFTFQKIEIQNNESKTMATDDWTTTR